MNAVAIPSALQNRRDVDDGRLLLRSHEFYTIDLRDGDQLRLTVLHGQTWATMERDQCDYVSSAGEDLCLRGPGRVVIEALCDTELGVAVIQQAA